MTQASRVLLVEANDQKRWIGSRVKPEIHIPPVGLLYLAASIRQARPEIELKLIETSLDATDDAAYLEQLRAFEPDLVGIRGVSCFIEEMKRIVALTKSWRDVFVLIGGPITSNKGARLLDQIPGTDAVAVGEGELTMASLILGERPETIGGLIFRRGGTTIETGPARIADDLDQLPFPDYSLVDLEKYRQTLSYTYNHRRQGVILTSRGCPYRCTYCNTFAGKKVRLRSADNVYREMLALHQRYGIADFYIIDDVFNIDQRRVKALLGQIIGGKHSWRLYFVNGLRADLLTFELVDLLVAAGTVWVTYGLESASPRIQKLIKKNLNLEQTREIIRYSQAKGVVVNIDTMYGFPGETLAEARQTFDYLESLHLPSVVPYHFSVRLYEGCEMVQQARAAGWDLDQYLGDNALTYNGMPTGNNTFLRHEMVDYMIEYHERFGTENKEHLQRCMGLLKNNGYTEEDLLDMYSVLLNLPLTSTEQLAVRRAS